MIEVSREEAFAAAALAKLVGRDLNNIGSLTNSGTGAKNIGTENVDVNKILNEMTIAKVPKPEGPLIQGASVDGQSHEVVLYKVDTPVIEQETVIENPFAKQLASKAPIQTPGPIAPMPLQTSQGVSFVGQFLGKKPVVAEIKQENLPTVSVPFVRTPSTTPEVPFTVTNSTYEIPSEPLPNYLQNIFEYLVKIDLSLSKIQKQLKNKKNEGKASKR